MMDKLLFTGASGFLGRNIIPILKEKYEITTCGFSPDDMINVNLAYKVPNLHVRYDVVLHACGKAHVVPRREEEKEAFYDVNYTGTVHLCEALEKVGVPKSFIFISTVAVYGCNIGINIDENHPLGGVTPYAKSKIMAEKYLSKWCSKHAVTLAILRPALLAGTNPPGNLGLMINGIKKGRYMSIAGGKARKSMLMVQDIANLVPKIVEKGGIYNVCDDIHPSFRELEHLICKQSGMNMPFEVPFWFAKILAVIGDRLGGKIPINSSRLDKMTKDLTFSNAKAKRDLGWYPLPVLDFFEI